MPFSDTPPCVTYRRIFFPPLYLIFYNRFYSGTPSLHPYANKIFGLPSSRYVPYDFFPPLYLIFNKRFYSGTPTRKKYLDRLWLTTYLIRSSQST